MFPSFSHGATPCLSILLIVLATASSAVTANLFEEITYPGSLSHAIDGVRRSKRGAVNEANSRLPQCAEGCCGRSHICGLRGCAFKARCGMDCCPPNIVQDVRMRARPLTPTTAGVPISEPVPDDHGARSFGHAGSQPINNGRESIDNRPFEGLSSSNEQKQHGIVRMRSYKNNNNDNIINNNGKTDPFVENIKGTDMGRPSGPIVSSMPPHLPPPPRPINDGPNHNVNQVRNPNGHIDHPPEGRMVNPQLLPPPPPAPLPPPRPVPGEPQQSHPPVDHPHRPHGMRPNGPGPNGLGSNGPGSHGLGPNGGMNGVMAPRLGGPARGSVHIQRPGGLGSSNSRGGFAANAKERRIVENAGNSNQPPGRMTFSSKPAPLHPPPGKSPGPKRPPAFTTESMGANTRERPMIRPPAFGKNTSEREKMPFLSRVKRCCECCMPDCHHGCIRNGGCGMCPKLAGNQNSSGITRGLRTKQHN